MDESMARRAVPLAPSGAASPGVPECGAEVRMAELEAGSPGSRASRRLGSAAAG